MKIYKMNSSGKRLRHRNRPAHSYRSAGDEVVVMVVKEDDYTFESANRHKNLINLLLSEESSWDDIAKEIISIYPKDADQLSYCIDENLEQ